MARAAYAEAATRVAGMFDSSAWRAMAESAAGSVAASYGDSSAARKHFESAADLYDRVGHAYWARRSRAQAEAA